MRWAALRFASLLCAVSALPLFGQEQVIAHEVDRQHVCSVQVSPYFGTGAGIGAGFVRIEGVGVDNRPHRIEVQLRTQPWSSSDISLRRELRLQPAERSRLFLPLPATQNSHFELTVTIDGVAYVNDMRAGTMQGAVGLLVTDRSETLAVATDMLLQLQGGAPKGRSAPQTVQCAGMDLPADWRMFTGFHVVLVDGRSRLATEQQEALRRFVHAGGNVVVGGPELLPAGPLRDLGERALQSGEVTHGLGRCVPVGGGFRFDEPAIALLPRVGRGVWPMPLELTAPIRIPGLGEAPVTLFLLVILAFAIVAGPVNFLALRRRKKPMLALVTVPLLGFGTTIVIVLFGMFHDGFGVRGTTRSWSLLDQRRHEVASVGVHSLFSGFTPGAFALADGELLLAPQAQLRGDRRSPHRWHLDGDTNKIDGGMLPSRTVTPLLSAEQGACRQRLRVKRGPGDTLVAATDGDLVLAGELLLRDRDGEYWRGDATGLARCSERDALSRLRRLRLGVASYEHQVDRDHGAQRVELPFVLDFGGEGSLSPGSYCGLFRRPPWLTDLGLATEEQESTHLVVGLLAPEDFLP